MKNFLRILSLFIFISNFSNAQTNIYHPFPDSNATWTCGYTGSWPIHSEHYTYMLNGDTSIIGSIYSKIYIPFVQVYGDTSFPIHQSGYQGCIREDTISKIVYVVLPGEILPRILYNFTYQVGDPFIGYMRHFLSVNDTVLAIDSILIGSDYRKMWMIGQLSNPFGYYYVIEGIGYGGGLLESTAGNYLDGPRLNLNCFQQDGITLYLFDVISCDIVDNLNDALKNYSSSFSLSPNPVSSQLVMKIDGSLESVITEIEIYNSLGSRVYSWAVNCASCPPSPGSYGGQSIVHCESFPPGIYFVKATSGEKIFFEKFIKD